MKRIAAVFSLVSLCLAAIASGSSGQEASKAGIRDHQMVFAQTKLLSIGWVQRPE